MIFTGARVHKGFTLLEILIAASIFAVIGLVCYQFISALDHVNESSTGRGQHLKDMQRMFMLMDRDILQTVSRPVRDPDQYDKWLSPVLGKERHFSLTRAGIPNTLGNKKSTLGRAEYAFVDNTVVLRTFEHLDISLASDPVEILLVEDIESMSIRYLDMELNENGGRKFTWHETWPPDLEADSGLTDAQPVAIEVSMNSLYLGELKRFFRVSGNEFID